jgi:hypothetical protein
MRIDSIRRMSAAGCACALMRHHNLHHHRKDSVQAGFIPSFLSGHLNRTDHTCAVASSAFIKPVVSDLAKSDHLPPCRSERSHTGIKQSPVQSPDL